MRKREKLFGMSVIQNEIIGMEGWEGGRREHKGDRFVGEYEN